jgi:hypothetical protein
MSNPLDLTQMNFQVQKYLQDLLQAEIGDVQEQQTTKEMASSLSGRKKTKKKTPYACSSKEEKQLKAKTKKVSMKKSPPKTKATKKKSPVKPKSKAMPDKTVVPFKTKKMKSAANDIVIDMKKTKSPKKKTKSPPLIKIMDMKKTKSPKKEKKSSTKYPMF